MNAFSSAALLLAAQLRNGVRRVAGNARPVDPLAAAFGDLHRELSGRTRRASTGPGQMRHSRRTAEPVRRAA